jgi:hypothetical protein
MAKGAPSPDVVVDLVLDLDLDLVLDFDLDQPCLDRRGARLRELGRTLTIGGIP